MKLKRMLGYVRRVIKRTPKPQNEPEIVRFGHKSKGSNSYSIQGGMVVREDTHGVFKQVVELVYEAASLGKSELVLVFEGTGLNDPEFQEDVCERLVRKIPNVFRDIYIEDLPVRVSGTDRFRIRIGLAWKLKKKQ